MVEASVFSTFPEIRFGFSVREYVREDHFLSRLGVKSESIAVQQQVHSNTVIRVSQPGLYPQCDALITNEPGVFLQVTVADCLPIFLYDPTVHAVGVIHSGWRGCANRIVRSTFEAMQRELSVSASTTRVYIGPSARSCCYEIGEEVAALFEPGYLVRTPKARAHLDMQAFTVSILTGLGFQQTHIEVSQHCTICTPELFHSYRRDGVKAGRMIGVMGMQPVDF